MEEEFFDSLDPDLAVEAKRFWHAADVFMDTDEMQFVDYLARFVDQVADAPVLKDIFRRAVRFFWKDVLCGDDVHVFAVQESPNDPFDTVRKLWLVITAAEELSDWRVPLRGPPRIHPDVKGIAIVFEFFSWIHIRFSFGRKLASVPH